MATISDLFSAPSPPPLPKWGEFGWISPVLGTWLLQFSSQESTGPCLEKLVRVFGLWHSFQESLLEFTLENSEDLDDSVRVGVLSGPQHCSDRGPEAWVSPFTPRDSIKPI